MPKINYGFKGDAITAANAIAAGAAVASQAYRYLEQDGTITPLTAPSGPNSLAATGGNHQVTLTWSAPTTAGSASVVGYIVFYVADDGSEVYLDTSGRTFTVTGLTNGTTYLFGVAAVNSAAGTGTFAFVSGTPTDQAVGDPYFANVTLLLHGNTGLGDSSSYGRSPTSSSGVSASSADPKYGAGSIRARSKYDAGTGGWLLFESRNFDTGISSVPVIGTGDYTIEWWMRLQDSSWNSGYGDILFDIFNAGNINPRGQRLLVGFRNDGAMRILEGSDTQDTSESSVPFDSWCHIAICRASGTRRVYINGTLALTQASSHDFGGTRFVLFTNVDDISQATSGHFTGYLDEFRVTLAARYTGSSLTVPSAAFLDS